MAKRVEAFRLSGRVEIDARRAKSDLQGVETQAGRTARAVRSISGAVSSVSSVLRGNYRDREGGSSGLLGTLSNISNIIQGIPQIGQLASSLVRPITDAAAAGVRFNAFLETAEIGFTNMLGSAQKAREHIAELQRFGATTPFQFRDLVNSSRFMQAFGFEAREVIPTLTSIGNLLSRAGNISAEALDGVIRQMAQMRAMARVTAEDMNAITTHGVPAWDLLAQATGKTVRELRALSERGLLRGDVATRLILEAGNRRAGGAMAAMAGTYNQLVSNYEDTYEQGLARGTRSLFEDLRGIMRAGAARTDSVETMAAQIDAMIRPASGLIRAAAEGALGGNLTAGLVEGVNSGRRMVEEAISSLALSSIIGRFQSLLGMESPSRVFHYFGEMSAQGYIDGFGERIAGFSPEVRRLVRGLTPEFQRGRGGRFTPLRSTIEELERLAQNLTVRAFLEAIRVAEGGAPNRIVGGRTFSDFSRHPNIVGLRTAQGPSTAAGNWQIVASTWEQKIQRELDQRLPDFSERSQMLGAIHLLRRTGALDALLGGNVQAALRLAGTEWQGLPGTSLAGGRQVSVDRFMQVFARAGGALPVQVVNQGGQAAAQASTTRPLPVTFVDRNGQARNIADVLRPQDWWPAIQGSHRDFIANLYAQTNWRLNNLPTTQNVEAHTEEIRMLRAQAEAAGVSERQLRIYQRLVSERIDLEQRAVRAAGNRLEEIHLEPLVSAAGQFAVIAPQLPEPINLTGEAWQRFARDMRDAPPVIREVGNAIRVNLATPPPQMWLHRPGELPLRDTSNMELLAPNPSSVAPIGGQGFSREEQRGNFGELTSAEQQVLSVTQKLKLAVGEVKQMGKEAFGSFAEGVGQIVEDFILMGEVGPDAMRKLTASVLAGLARQATVRAIWETAEGIVLLAKAIANPLAAPKYIAAAKGHFMAAALFAGIAGGAAIGGRAVAGNSFQKDQGGGEVAGARKDGGNVIGGRAYIVGEERAEVFVPHTSGYVHRSVDDYARTHGGSSSAGALDRELVERMIAASERLAAAAERMESMSPDDVVRFGASRGLPRAMRSDAKLTEEMQRGMGFAK